MKEQNLLFLMTTPNAQRTPAMQHFIKLQREEELEKFLERSAAKKAMKEKELADKEKKMVEQKKSNVARTEADSRDRAEMEH